MSFAPGGGTGGSGTSLTATSDFVLTQTGSNVTIALATTGVVAGAGYNTFTVDDRGRISAAAITAAGSGNSLLFASAISATVTGSLVTLDLSATGVTAGSSYNSLTVDARGRVTNAQTVAASGSAVTFWEVMSFIALGGAA